MLIRGPIPVPIDIVNNPLDRAGLGSFKMDQMKVNADVSVDLYVGPSMRGGPEP